MDILRERLRGRGTDSEDVIEKRINIGINECVEIEKSNIFNFKIVNNDLDKAYFDFKDSIKNMYPDIKI